MVGIPGHGGKPGRSGRRKKPNTIVNEAIDNLRKDLPQLFEQLRERALQGDRDSIIYLIDRAIGKPKQQTELTGGEEIGSSFFVALFEAIARERRREIGVMQIAAIEEGVEPDTIDSQS